MARVTGVSASATYVRDIEVSVYSLEREIGTAEPVGFMVSVAVIADVIR